MQNVASCYVHIPFCKKICNYCDFPKWLYNEGIVKKYLKALRNEIIDIYKGENLKTLYIGGGTPSCLSSYELKELFSILKILKIDSSCEITIECNIEDITKEKLELFKEFGINRLSIGIETTCKNHFKFLGRSIDKEEVKEKIKLCKKLGFDNINLDLMYAFLNQTKDEVKSDVEFLLSLDVSHISTYSLQIEKHTKLSIDKVKPIDSDLDAEFYFVICNMLKENGYNHYEISNFAKENMESKHNLVYWKNLEYYGFGLGAASYLANKRITNTKGMNNYINGNRVVESVELEDIDKAYYELILALRTKEGVLKENLLKKYNGNIKKWYNIDLLLKQGLLKENSTHYYIEEKNFYILNSILVKL